MGVSTEAGVQEDCNCPSLTQYKLKWIWDVKKALSKMGYSVKCKWTGNPNHLLLGLFSAWYTTGKIRVEYVKVTREWEVSVVRSDHYVTLWYLYVDGCLFPYVALIWAMLDTRKNICYVGGFYLQG